jgi:hypothetical protein
VHAAKAITLPAFRRGETVPVRPRHQIGSGRTDLPSTAADSRRQRQAYFSQIIYIVEWEGVVATSSLRPTSSFVAATVGPEDEMTITQSKGAATLAVFRHSGAGRGRRLDRRWGVGRQVGNRHPQPDESIRRQALARAALRTGVAARKVQQQSAIRNRCGRHLGCGT